MSNHNVVVFASGTGSNFNAICEASRDGIIPAKVALLVCNKANAGVIQLASVHKVPCLQLDYEKGSDRDEYYQKIMDHIDSLNQKISMVVLAGWMLILTPKFIDNLNQKCGCVINLHPALPGQIPGANAIEKAWEMYQNGRITESGLMVHYVVPEVDAGQVIDFRTVSFNETDTLDTFRQRIQYFEKPTLLNAINKILMGTTSEFDFHQKKHEIERALDCDDRTSLTTDLLIKGKVRDVLAVKNSQKTYLNFLVINHSDRLSAFNRPICDVPGKGHLLMLQNIWWMKQTQHIIPNHYLCHFQNSLLVHRCNRIPLEIVVRAYMTGSTSTSLWTHYKNGSRDYCGNVLPEGLVKNQVLAAPIITPTTKDVDDVPISGEEILNRELLTPSQWKYISTKAMELFRFGQKVADDKGLILVDTKYEFGFDINGNIILVDEIHTSDSSRYWLKETYQSRYEAGEEPDKLDKDAIRDWLVANGDPKNLEKELPEIPTNVIDKVLEAYQKQYTMLTGTTPEVMASSDCQEGTNYCLEQIIVRSVCKVVIIAGSKKDAKHVGKLMTELEKRKLTCLVHYSSAHRNTQHVIDVLEGYKLMTKQTRQKFIFVTVAGKSNALSGVVAANCDSLVIACPPFSDKADMWTNIQSSLQCPADVPVLTTLDPINVAVCCVRAFSLRE